MSSSSYPKPVGGIRSAALVLSGTSACGSVSAVLTSAEEVPIIEGLSEYEERITVDEGVMRCEHRLTLGVSPSYAREHLGTDVSRRLALEGTVATIVTESGEMLLAGRSERMGIEQPLRLTEMRFTTGITPHDTPVVMLTFRSIDTSRAARIEV